MHELSLVQSIFSTLESEFSSAELDNILAVELKVGLLSNVEPILLQNAFTAYQETKGMYSQVELKTQMVEIRIHCSQCDTESKVENYIFKCDTCGNPSSNIVSGEELLIHKIHFQS